MKNSSFYIKRIFKLTIFLKIPHKLRRNISKHHVESRQWLISTRWRWDPCICRLRRLKWFVSNVATCKPADLELERRYAELWIRFPAFRCAFGSSLLLSTGCYSTTSNRRCANCWTCSPLRTARVGSLEIEMLPRTCS